MTIDTTTENAVLSQLVEDLHGPWRPPHKYSVVKTQSWQLRTESDGAEGKFRSVVSSSESYAVLRGDDEIATLYLNDDGTIRNVLIKHGVAFENVPKALRALID